MPRIARLIAIGYPHHIVQRGNNRQAIFFDDNDKVKYLYFLKKYSNECGCAIHSYCLMDNHIHLLAVPSVNTSFAKCMQRTSLTYTQYINQKYNESIEKVLHSDFVMPAKAGISTSSRFPLARE